MLRCADADMRTTETIDDDVLAVARALAERRRVSLGSALSELARRGYRIASAAADGGDGSMFAVPPDAKPITNEDVYQAMCDCPHPRIEPEADSSRLPSRRPLQNALRLRICVLS